MGTQTITLGHLLETYYRESNDYRDRGDKFERLVRSYLTTDPGWSLQFSDVWLWQDYPNRGRRADTGVDLVAKDKFTGELTAIQCKFLDPEATVAKGDVDSFISASPRPEFSRRLLAHTARIGPTAQSTLEAQDPPVQVLDPHQMDRADIQWAEFQVEFPDRMVQKDGKKTPFPYQRQAMADVAQGFQGSDRGKLIMACGTGKTFTSLQIMQDQTPPNATVLFLVPSIALLDQTLREWKRDAATDFRALAVCSDVKVGKNTAQEDISTTDLLVPATTDATRLVEQQQNAQDYDGRTVVFSTYQSIDVLHHAQQRGFAEFDLIICDEAHRTTGATAADQDPSAFTKIHSDTFIAGAKRLYMTATPKVFDEGAKKKADENSVVVASMDDPRLYGPEFHRLGFGTAVAQGLLTDYKVLVLAVDETSVNKHLQRLLTDEEGELRIDDVAKIVGCWNGLSQRGKQSGDEPAQAMQRAVAFASNIKESQRVASMFEKITEELATTSDDGGLVCRAEHVDGTMNVTERSSKLNWLEAPAEDNEARILTNARCLSEGVDVPSLDAVLFLNPRNSQVDVVQSVGRVMRRAQGKDYGYIILPVGVPVGQTPEQALRDNTKYKVIWSVLNALRSHDDRFEATVNKIDLNQDRSEKIDIIGVGIGTEGNDDASLSSPQQLTLDLEFPGLDEWKDAIYAKIVQKVGDRKYWEDWASDIASVAARHTQRITTLVTTGPNGAGPEPRVAERFGQFVAALKHNLNEGISEADAISMLSQHLITKPVFDALFSGYDFAAHNPVSVVMQDMIDTLEGNNLQAETASLEGFYKSVADRASGVDNAEGKQRIITELYENFFKRAFPAQADALGVVYTPVEIVDFIIRAVDDLSKEHFGAGITDEGVHVLDPFTGTGTFIVRLLQSGVITSHDLARKYSAELHANEIMLLAYYIAAINIEATYHGLVKEQAEHDGEAPYVPFEGIVLGDTFQMTEEHNTFDMEMFTSNNSRVRRQLDTDIRVIMGNPPWSAGQERANDNNANQPYPTLDARIAHSYLSRSEAALRRKLYDSYIRAIRWGTDRIGDRGILAYVSNGGYIDSNSADGLRKTFVEDFDHLYIYNLRGNQRTAGEQSRREGGKVFGAGSRATVAIMVGVKDPTHTGNCVLHYRDIGDYLTREDKLAIVRDSTITSTRWETITPNAKGEWINQSSDTYDTYHPLGDRKSATGMDPIHKTYTLGAGTNRDAWVYNFKLASAETNVMLTIEAYEDARHDYHRTHQTLKTAKDVARWRAEQAQHSEPNRISWSETLELAVARDTKLQFKPSSFTVGRYRPFTKMHLYFDRSLIHRPGHHPRLFPSLRHRNFGFHANIGGTGGAFCVLAIDGIPDLNFFGAGGQFFPRYTWELSESAEPNLLEQISDPTSGVVIDGYRRVDNITDATLARYQQAFGDDVNKDAIFVQTYALLHSEQYRTKYAAELKRQIPRIPLLSASSDFWAFADVGQKLLDLHLNYEDVDPYPLDEETTLGNTATPEFYRVQKMKWAGKSSAKDRSRLVYNSNITLSGIPDEAHEYMLGSRSALEWLVDRYQVKTDKASGIINDPNAWAEEQGNPRYIIELVKKVTTVSVETVQLTRSLPALKLD